MADDASVEAAIEANAADLHRYLLRRLADPDDAAEALSDVLLTVWRRRDRLPEEAHEARLWLYGVAANVQRNQQRGRARRAALVRRLSADRTAGPHQPPDVAGVRDAIAALPHDLAELVRLRHWEGFSLAEAAQVLGIPASTARTRYAAARRRLRAALDPAGPDPGCTGSGATDSAAILDRSLPIP